MFTTMARLNETGEAIPEDAQIPMSTHAESEREYDGGGVDPQTSSRKELIGYIISQIDTYQNRLDAGEEMY